MRKTLQLCLHDHQTQVIKVINFAATSNAETFSTCHGNQNSDKVINFAATSNAETFSTCHGNQNSGRLYTGVSIKRSVVAPGPGHFFSEPLSAKERWWLLKNYGGDVRECMLFLSLIWNCFIVLAFCWCKPDKRNTALTNKTKLYLSSNIF